MTTVRDEITPVEAGTFATPASADQLTRAGAALRANGFGVEILGDATEARRRVREVIPQGTVVLTASSETPKTRAAVAVWMSTFRSKASSMAGSRVRAAMIRSSICE